MRFQLFATTAIVAVAWLAGSTLPAASGTMSDLVRDKNREFLRDYGYRLSLKVSCGDSYCNWSGQYAAAPVFGEGKTIREIDVAYSARSNFIADVLLCSSDYGSPWGALAKASKTFLAGQRRARVSIKPTYLEKGTKYWIVEEMVPPNLHSSSAFYSGSETWLYENSHRHGALYQQYSFSDPDYQGWRPLVGGRPYARVR